MVHLFSRGARDPVGPKVDDCASQLQGLRVSTTATAADAEALRGRMGQVEKRLPMGPMGSVC